MNEYCELIMKLKHKVVHDELLNSSDKDELCEAIKQLLDVFWPILY